MRASAQQTFQAAVALAKTRRSPLLGAHIVIASCDQEHGTVARALNAGGIDRNRLADAARQVLADTH